MLAVSGLSRAFVPQGGSLRPGATPKGTPAQRYRPIRRVEFRSEVPGHPQRGPPPCDSLDTHPLDRSSPSNSHLPPRRGPRQAMSWRVPPGQDRPTEAAQQVSASSHDGQGSTPRSPSAAASATPQAGTPSGRRQWGKVEPGRDLGRNRQADASLFRQDRRQAPTRGVSTLASAVQLMGHPAGACQWGNH